MIQLKRIRKQVEEATQNAAHRENSEKKKLKRDSETQRTERDRLSSK